MNLSRSDVWLCDAFQSPSRAIRISACRLWCHTKVPMNDHQKGT
jgi:hypothetical protein